MSYDVTQLKYYINEYIINICYKMIDLLLYNFYYLHKYIYEEVIYGKRKNLN